jgi:hypothetical protein
MRTILAAVTPSLANMARCPALDGLYLTSFAFFACHLQTG